MRIRRRKSVNVDAFDHTSEVMSMGNTCICCGDPIPEGRQVCPICVYEAELQAEREKAERVKGEEEECTTDNE